MKPGKADFVRTYLLLLFLFLLAAVPAYCQRGTLDLNVGQTTDQFGAIPSVSGAVLDITGEVTIIKPSAKKGGPSIVAGGELRAPTDDANHSKEYAVYGGAAFAVHNFSIGVNAEVRKIIMPPATVENQILNRYNMNLLELPVVIKYKFGPGKRAFVQVQGEPEFTPHYKSPKGVVVQTPNPAFNYGYTLRASLGYEFGKWWYVKGTGETRYFNFAQGLGNPTSLYNWKSNLITGGVGVRF
jgi:hypothetical protein